MKADSFLREKEVDFELVEQDKPTTGCEEAAEQRGVDISQIVKSLIVEIGGEKLHVCVPGDRELSEKKMGEEYRMVDPEVSKDITGQESGTVHPFSSDLKHVVDGRLFRRSRVSFTNGVKQEGVVLTAGKFRKALERSGFGFEVKDVVQAPRKEVVSLEECGLSEGDARFVARNGFLMFQELEQDYDAEEIVTALRKALREMEEVNAAQLGKLIERADSETHMQRLAEKLEKDGELPDETDHDLDEAVEKVLEANQDAVEDFRNGRDSAINFLMGRLMQRTNGKADAEKAKQKILGEIDGS